MHHLKRRKKKRKRRKRKKKKLKRKEKRTEKMKEDQKMKREVVMMNKKAAHEEVGTKGVARKMEKGKQGAVMKNKALVSSFVLKFIVYYI